MAKKTGFGLGGLVKDVIKASITGEKVNLRKGKTTKSTKTRSRSKPVDTPAAAPATQDTTVQQRFFQTNNPTLSTNTSKFREKLNNIVNSVGLGTKWHKLGRLTSDQILKDNSSLINVKDESEPVQQNFETIQNQFVNIANFMVKTDYRFADLDKSIKRTMVSVTTETAKNHISLVNHIHVKLNTFDNSLSKMTSKIETHDRQIDEIYSEIKKKKKEDDTKGFLDRRKEAFLNSFKKSDNQFKKSEKEESGGLFDLLTKLIPAEELAAAAAAAAAGYLGVKKGGPIIKNAIKGAAGAAVRGSRGLGFSAGAKAGSALAGRAGMRAGAKLGAKIGAKFIPGVGLVLIGKDFYDGYSQDGIMGGVKNALTLGMAYDDAGTQKTADGKQEVNEINLSSIKDIVLSAKRDIRIESQRELTIKADRIILDSSKIEIKAKNIKQLQPGDSSGAVTQSQNIDPKTGQIITRSGGVGSMAPANQGAISKWWNSFKSGGSRPAGSPYMGRGGNPGSTPFRQRPSGGGGGYSGGYSGGGNDTGPTSTVKPVAARPQNALSSLSVKEIPLDKKGAVDMKAYKTFLQQEVKKQGLDKLSPADAAKYGIDGSPESWSNFLMGLTKKESSFSPGVHGDRGRFGGHGSRGLFQLSPDDAVNYKLQKTPFTYAQLHDPETNAQAAIAIMKQRLQKGSTIRSGLGAYWGPIKRGENIPYGEYSKIKAASGKFVLPGMQKVVEKNDKNLDLIQKSRQFIMDRSAKYGQAPKLEQFGSEAEYNKALDNYNSSLVHEKQSALAGTRKGRLKPELVDQLNYAANQTGVQVEVFSGGQRMPGAPGRVGSTRHNQGGAADFKLFRIDENGKKRYLSMNNQDDRAIMQSFVTHSVKAGATGVGAGVGYMGEHSIHVGGGDVASWGGSKWIGQAHREGLEQQKEFGAEGLKKWKKTQENIIDNVSHAEPEKKPMHKKGFFDGHPMLKNKKPKGPLSKSKNIFNTKKVLENSKKTRQYFNQPVDENKYNIKDITDRIQKGRFQFGEFDQNPKGMTIHHTAGRGNEYGVMQTFHERNFPAQWIVNRKGEIVRALPEGRIAHHMRAGQGIGEGLNNYNMEGVEVIANNDKDILPEQMDAVKRLVAMRAAKFGWEDPKSAVYAHGEINEHKEDDEGATITKMIREQGVDKELAEYKKIQAKKNKSPVRQKIDRINKVLQANKTKKQAAVKAVDKALPGRKAGEATKQKLASIRQKKAEIAARPKQNVAQNGAISGGQRVKEKKVDTYKAVPKTEKKPQQSAEASPKSSSSGSGNSSSKSYSSGGGGGNYATPTGDNGSDSIPPGPADDGYGEYKNCLI